MIARDPARAAGRLFDVIVIGGGIYGVALLRELAQRGLTACLCEAVDFGGNTSRNSLRILHGGLRYLQTMDLRRFFQSVKARREMARLMPELVKPLSCLMPLYGAGLKRPEVMRTALFLNDLLSLRRNDGLAEGVRLGAGSVMNREMAIEAFPGVRSQGLRGAAQWYDYFMRSSERILMELLRDACAQGAQALNYACVDKLIVAQGKVQGVRIKDTLTGSEHLLRAGIVVNCTGPESQRFAQSHGAAANGLFRPSLAFNLLLDKQLPCESALAVAAPQPDAPVLFLVPQQHSTFAGTMHLPRPAGTRQALPTSDEIESFLAQLRAAIPGFEVQIGNVRRVFAGLLPAKAVETAELAKREVLIDHGRDGMRGFFSLAGVKYTTALDVVRQVLGMLPLRSTGAAGPAEKPLATSAATSMLIDADQLWSRSREELRDVFGAIVRDECVYSIDDLVLRRSNWSTTAIDLDRVKDRVVEVLGALPESKHQTALATG